MTQSLMEAIQAGQVGKIRPTYGYYRQANGWITCAVVTELEELQYRREGWQPLPKYGRFDMAGAYAANHPLELLFMKGGAKELPLDQIIESGFYLDPPVVPGCGMGLNQMHKAHFQDCWEGARTVHFPQLDGLDLGEGWGCRFCDAVKPTEKARDQHESVMHKDESSDIRTGQTLAEAMVRGLQPQYGPTVAESALAVLSSVGLNKKQVEALRAAGINVPEATDGE